MGYKKTVVDLRGLTVGEAGVASAQAEITWDIAEQVGIEKGRKEVVEWIKDNTTTPLGEDAYGYYVWEGTLKAKLKEWGI